MRLHEKNRHSVKAKCKDMQKDLTNPTQGNNNFVLKASKIENMTVIYKAKNTTN